MTVIDIDLRPWVVAEIPGRVVAGDAGPTFQPESSARWLTALDRCIGRAIRLRLYRPKLRRTLEQNAYLWAVVYPDILAGLRMLAESVGELPVFTDEDELHEALKWTFLRKLQVLPGAGQMEMMPRSSRLSIEEFSEYLDKVKTWAAERHIYIREPHEAVLA